MANGVGKKWIIKMNFRNSWKSCEQNFFESGLRRGGYCDRIAVTTESGGDPKNVDFPDGWGIREPAAILVRSNRQSCYLLMLMTKSKTRSALNIRFQRIPANSRDQYKLEIFENLIDRCALDDTRRTACVKRAGPAKNAMRTGGLEFFVWRSGSETLRA